MDKSQEEFIQWYDRYHDAVWRFILFKVSNAETAWDLSQESFLKTWEYWQRGGATISNPRAFLFTVARNMVIDHWRGRAHTPVTELTEEMEQIIPGKTGNDAHERLVLKDEARQMQQCIAKLPEEDREILTLRFTEELPFKDIARVVGKGEIAVRVQAHRALKKLKVILDTHA